MIYIIAFIAAIAGFLFGFDEGIIAGAIGFIKNEFLLNDWKIGLMMGILPFGALISACGAGFITDYIGRRKALIAVALLFCIGTVFAASATAYSLLVLARFILGTAIGIASVVTPMYISEASPAKNRGELVSCYQLAITFGILCSYLMSYVFVEHQSWRLMFISGLIPALLLLIGMLFLPESPRWLFLKGKDALAHQVLEKLNVKSHADISVENELREVREVIKEEKIKPGLKELFSPKVFPVLIVGIGLFIFQQLSGINVVIYYAPTILSQIKFGTASTQVLATVGIGFVNFIVTIAAMMLIDKIGRKALLYIGFACTALSLALIAYTIDNAELQWVTVGSMILFIAAFAISLGPVPFVLISEIFPLEVRGIGMSFAAIANWGFNSLVVFLFPIMQSNLGQSATFAIYAIICFLGILFTFRFVPETKGISLEHIEQYLMTGKPLRDIQRDQK